MVDCFTPPEWLGPHIQKSPESFLHPDDKIKFVIELSRLNVVHRTGGPFGAAVFESESGRLVAAGVNLVVPAACSIAHAEILALMGAHKAVHSYDLGCDGMPAHELVSSSQPCAMCFGAVVWSGVKRLVYGASAEDVQSITRFDEGPLHPEWKKELAQRRITVEQRGQTEASEILSLYVDSGGLIYNGRRQTR
ncbi:MAG: nucleoside deaminase [Deltaproteobacteria bacterium]|nr:nucleoside deaminase [Deltaproteobacteria bacterium]